MPSPKPPDGHPEELPWLRGFEAGRERMLPEIDRLRTLVCQLGQEVNLDRCIFDDIRADVERCISLKESPDD